MQSTSCSTLRKNQSLQSLIAAITSLSRSKGRNGHITYWNLWNIDWNTNPQFYTDSSNAVDDAYKPPDLEDFDRQGEEEGEEESPLPIPGPSGTHPRILQSELNSDEQSSESMSNRPERHLGTIIEEMFWEREWHQS